MCSRSQCGNTWRGWRKCFPRLQQQELEIKLSKCTSFQKRVKYRRSLLSGVCQQLPKVHSRFCQDSSTPPLNGGPVEPPPSPGRKGNHWQGHGQQTARPCFSTSFKLSPFSSIFLNFRSLLVRGSSLSRAGGGSGLLPLLVEGSNPLSRTWITTAP